MRGSQGVKGDVWGIPWGHRVGLMSLLIIHEAYMPIACLQGIQIFIAGKQADGSTKGSTRGPRGDLKKQVAVCNVNPKV